MGPTTMEELFKWPAAAAVTLFPFNEAGCSDDLRRLQGLCVVTTTDFSGMGTAELSVKMVVDALANRLCAGRGRGQNNVKRREK